MTTSSNSPHGHEFSTAEFLNGGGEAAAMIRARDWHAHPLGDPSGWSDALCTALSLVLNYFSYALSASLLGPWKLRGRTFDVILVCQLSPATVGLPGILLRRLKREQAEALLQIGIRQSGDTLVCCREDGEPRLPNSLTNDFHYMMTRVKDLPRVRFHDLRHSHATQLLLEGVHPKIAQERLGHSTITTTLDLYSHVTDSMQVDAAERLDAAWRRR
jgi:hypothetical protein